MFYIFTRTSISYTGGMCRVQQQGNYDIVKAPGIERVAAYMDGTYVVDLLGRYNKYFMKQLHLQAPTYASRLPKISRGANYVTNSLLHPGVTDLTGSFR